MVIFILGRYWSYPGLFAAERLIMHVETLDTYNVMITTIVVILLILWLLGFVGFHVLGGFIHILLVIAVVLFLVRIIRGENPVK